MQPVKTEAPEADRCRPDGASNEPTAQRYTVNVNGVARQVVIEGDTPLLWVKEAEVDVKRFVNCAFPTQSRPFRSLVALPARRTPG